LIAAIAACRSTVRLLGVPFCRPPVFRLFGTPSGLTSSIIPSIGYHGRVSLGYRGDEIDAGNTPGAVRSQIDITRPAYDQPQHGPLQSRGLDDGCNVVAPQFVGVIVLFSARRTTLHRMPAWFPLAQLACRRHQTGNATAAQATRPVYPHQQTPFGRMPGR
jgi:hypothetical protein